jgi:hypothetical protein
VVGKPASIVKAQDDTSKMSLRRACDVVIWIDLASALINEIAALHFILLAMTESDTRNDKVYISEL